MKCTVPVSLLLLALPSLLVAEDAAGNEKEGGAKRETIVDLAVKKEAEGKANKAFDVENPKERSMFEGMTILASSGQWTIVPKNAILAMPPAMVFHVVDKPAGEFTQWPEFSRRNRGWLISHEVGIETIKGLDPFSEKETKLFKSSFKVVVATYNNSPVSVIPHTEKPENEK